MTTLPQSDWMVEGVYDVVNKQSSERARAEVARAALLAAQYRAGQLAKASKPALTPKRAGDALSGRDGA